MSLQDWFRPPRSLLTLYIAGAGLALGCVAWLALHQLTTLEAVVVFYNEGGRASPFIDPILEPLHLTVGEREALVVFLGSLTGQVTDGGT